MKPRARLRPRPEALERRSLMAAGDLDPTFGLAGKTIADYFGADNPAGESSGATQVALQTDGKLVIAGGLGGYGLPISSTSQSYRLGVERLNPDGSPDPTFGGGDGRVVLTFPGVTKRNFPFFGAVEALGIGADGKIVVVSQVPGPYGIGQLIFAATRLNPDGTADATFDGDGFATYPFLTNPSPNAPKDLDQARSLAIGPDGSIVVAGSGPEISGFDYVDGQLVVTGQADMMLIRIRPDGSLDTSFENGPRFTDIPLEPGLNLVDFHDLSGASTERHDYASVVRLLADGSYLVAGSTEVEPDTPGPYGMPIPNSAEYDFAIAKLKPDGSLDPSFGLGGRLTLNLRPGPNERAVDLAVQPDGKIVLLGTTPDATDRGSSDIAVIRLNPDGTLDPTFEGDGVAVIALDGPMHTERPLSLAIRPDGKIVIVGSAYQEIYLLNLTGAGFVLRLNADGSRDPSYGTNGVTRFAPAPFLPLPGAGYGLNVLAAVVAPDGKVLGVAQGVGDAPPSSAIAFRVVADEAPAPVDGGTGGGTTGGGTTGGGTTGGSTGGGTTTGGGGGTIGGGGGGGGGGITVTMPPPRDTTPPRVLGVTVTTNKKTKAITGLVLRFSEALDEGSAETLSHYDFRPTARKAKPIHLRRASYDGATNTVTLTPAGKLSGKAARRLTVQDIADLARNLLDGDGNGTAGGAYTAIVRGSGRK